MYLANFVQRTKEKQSQQHRCLGREQMALLLWQKQETLFIEKKKKKKQEKKRYYGVKCNSVEMPRLLFSEEAV